MTTHYLKCWPEFFRAIQRGDKTFDVRKGNDRTYKPGDQLFLREWNPVTGEYTGQDMTVRVTYVLHGAPFLPGDLWVMAIAQ